MEEFFGHPDMYYRRFEMMRRPMRRHLGVASKPATNEPEEKSIFHLITARSLQQVTTTDKSKQHSIFFHSFVNSIHAFYRH